MTVLDPELSALLLKLPPRERERIVAAAAARLRMGGGPPTDGRSREARALKNAAARPPTFEEFGRKYRDDPAGFARDCVRWDLVGKGVARTLAPYQEEILANVVAHRRESVRGPHGLGKSFVNSLLVLWFSLTRDALKLDWKVPTTASAWRQLEEYLWPEIRKWAQLLDWEKIGRTPFRDVDELQTLGLKLRHGRAFALTSNKPALIEGAHASQILFVFDESKVIPGEMFDAAEGALGTANPDYGTEVYAISTSTPGASMGRFYEIQTRRKGFEDWHVRHVTREEVIAAGLLNVEFAEARRRQWGAESPQYLNRIEGEFADSDAEVVIPLSWVEMAVERWHERKRLGTLTADGYTCTGADIASGGGDQTAFAIRYGRVITDIRTFGKANTMQTANRLQALAKRFDRGYIVVDAMGVGAGVYDRLRELRVRVRAFVGAKATEATDSTGEWGFANVRSAAWWNLRQLLDPSRNPDLCLPPIEELGDQLSAPRYGEVRTKPPVYQVEPKDQLIARLGYSTDLADAVIMALYKEAVSRGHTRVPQAKSTSRWGGRAA